MHFVEQAEWDCNDLNDLLQRDGAEATRGHQNVCRRGRYRGWWAEWKPAGRGSICPRPISASMPISGWEDFTTRFTVERDKEGNERDVFQDVAGFRIADIACIDIASATATMTGEIDRQPNQLFSVTAQTPFHGSGLLPHRDHLRPPQQRRLGKRVRPVWNPSSLLRLITIWGGR